jgi:hypothetical protein
VSLSLPVIAGAQDKMPCQAWPRITGNSTQAQRMHRNKEDANSTQACFRTEKPNRNIIGWSIQKG